MDIFRAFAVLLLATASTGKPASTMSHGNAYEFNNTSVFTQIVPTNDLSVRDAIYMTPELLFVGKSNGDIMRCLYRDPSVCEMFYSYSSSTGVTSIVISGEYLYASLANGVMLRCHLNQKNSCTTFDNISSKINDLAVSDRYIHAGLSDGRMLRCDLYQPDDCKTFNKYQDGITSLAATEKYIYAGLTSRMIWRCAVASENSCRLIDTQLLSQMQRMTAIEETVVGVTDGGTYWNCTRGYNCTEKSAGHCGYTSMTIFDRSFYTVVDSNIWIHEWESFKLLSIYDHHEGAISIAFAHKTYKMHDRFVNEEKTCLSDIRCPPYMVYYEINQRPTLEVFVKRGKLYNARGALVDTRNADVGHSGRSAIFAMGPSGQLLLSIVHNTVLRTSSLFAGHPVAGAGEMVVENGVIKSVRACSDHYRPTVELNQQVINALYMKGYTDKIDNLPCCKGIECGQVDVDQTTIANVQKYNQYHNDITKYQ